MPLPVDFEFGIGKGIDEYTNAIPLRPAKMYRHRLRLEREDPVWSCMVLVAVGEKDGLASS